MEEILTHWEVDFNTIDPITDGLINGTWKVDSGDQSYLLQRINSEVFIHPKDLQANHGVLTTHLAKSDYRLKCPDWLTGRDGEQLYFFDNQYWRLGTFFENTETFHLVTDQDMSWKVGQAYGLFDKALLTLLPNKVKDTIIDFHLLNRYLEELHKTSNSASQKRITTSKDLLAQVDHFIYLSRLPFPKTRVIHNDAKISNLLFKQENVVSIIDWDTTMAGHISWEFADLVRTSTISVAEDHLEEGDIHLQKDFLQGLVSGFKSQVYDHLHADEKDSLYEGTLYLIFEQAVRFLSDYLAGDIYYKCDYDDHNYIRARNQFRILQILKQDKVFVKDCITRS